MRAFRVVFICGLVGMGMRRVLVSIVAFMGLNDVFVMPERHAQASRHGRHTLDWNDEREGYGEQANEAQTHAGIVSQRM